MTEKSTMPTRVDMSSHDTITSTDVSADECACCGLPYSGYISSEFNFVLFVLIFFERIYSERKFNVGVTASSGHVV